MVESWLDHVEMPDVQVGWILANHSRDWARAVLARLDEPDDPARRMRAVEILGTTSRAIGTDPPQLGNGPEPAAKAVPEMVDLDEGLEALPPRTAADDPTDARRFQGLLSDQHDVDDPSVSSVVEFEYSARTTMRPLAVTGDAGPLRQSLPPEGLETVWMVMADVELRSRDRRVFTGPAGEGRWYAHFELSIPQVDDSDAVPVEVVHDGGIVDLDVVISSMVTGDPIRRLTMTLIGPAEDTPTSAVLTGSDAIIDVPGAARPRPFEFATAPATFTISVDDGRRATVIPGPNQGYSPDTVDWPSPNLLDGIQTLRSHAETVRGTFSADFDALDHDELHARLERDLVTGTYLYDTMDWAVDPGLAGPDAQARWDRLSCSEELLALAHEGYNLYELLFPAGTGARLLLDGAPAGTHIHLVWTVDQDEAATIPWGFLYTAPPPLDGPLDPTPFFGLRFRLAWTKWKTAGGDLRLGHSDDIERIHVLYSGDDVTGQQAAAQRAYYRGFPRHRLVPGHGTDDRAEIVDQLTQPAGNSAVMHLYCQCSFDAQRGNAASLVFGSTIDGDDYVLTGRFLGRDRLEARPLVFVNACESASGDAYHVNRLEQRFFNRGCRAFMGTETRVPVTLAACFATVFFTFLELTIDGKRLSAGEAAVQARRYLWNNYRNLGGLFYSYVNGYQLRIDPEQR